LLLETGAVRRPARLVALSLAALACAWPLAAITIAQEDDGEHDVDLGLTAEDAADGAHLPDDDVEAAPVMDLAAFTRHAERTYPGIRAAESRIRAAQAQLDEAWVSPFFQGIVSAGFALAPEAHGSPIFSQDAQVPVSNPWQPVVGFSVEGLIPLWTFGKLGGLRDAARAGIRAAESDRARVRNQLLYDVRRAYFALQLSLDLQQMLAEGLPQIRAALQHVEERLAENDPEVTETDRYRLSAALAEVEARDAQARHLEMSSRAALRILTGVHRYEVPDCPLALVDVELEPLDHYLSRALSDRPEVRMLEAATRAREASLDIARAGFLPDIGLTYRFAISYAPGITDQTNPFVIDPANYMNIGAGLAMRWSLDLWGNAYRVDRESALLDDVRGRSDEARLGLELEVNDTYQTVVEALRRVESYDRGRRETRAWFISAAQGVEVGAATLTDMVDAVRAYFTARYSHLQAIADADTALANLARVSATNVTERWERSCD
jgi:outer membrane protein TolC